MKVRNGWPKAKNAFAIAFPPLKTYHAALPAPVYLRGQPDTYMLDAPLFAFVGAAAQPEQHTNNSVPKAILLSGGSPLLTAGGVAVISPLTGLW